MLLNNKEKPRSLNLTAVILNWKRPQNVQKIINYLVKFSFITEIIVWNNSPNKFEPENSSNKLKVINSKKNLKDKAKYLAFCEASNEYVFYQDDDWHTKHYLESMHFAFCLNPEVIHIARGELSWILHHKGSRKCINEELGLQAEFSYIGTGSMFAKKYAKQHLDYIDKYFIENEKAYADVAFTLFYNQPFITLQVSISKGSLDTGQEVAFSSQDSFDDEIYSVKVKSRQTLVKMSREGKQLPEITIKSVFQKIALYTNFLPYNVPSELVLFDPENLEHCQPTSLSDHRKYTNQDAVKIFRMNPYFSALIGIYDQREAKNGWRTDMKKGDIFGLTGTKKTIVKILLNFTDAQANKFVSVTQKGMSKNYSLQKLNNCQFEIDKEVYFTAQNDIQDLYITFH